MNLAIIILIVVLVVAVYLLVKLWRNRNRLVVQSDGRTPFTIPAASLTEDINFTYSIWIYVQNWADLYGQEKVILQRGNGTVFIPKIALGQSNNTLSVTVGSTSCTVTNIPLQRWVHVATVVNSKVIDVYVDGKLVKTCVMSQPIAAPAGSFGDLFLAPGGSGFTGSYANLQYFSSSQDPQAIWNLYSQGSGVSGSGMDAYGLKLGLTKNKQEIGSLSTN